MEKKENKLQKNFLVYSCSGCSSAAQTANQIALKLDRSLLAEMSCIVGVGGGVPSLVKIAKSGRPIVALDGCGLHCSLHCLKNQNIEPELHFTLSEFGVKKLFKTDFDPDVVEALFEQISTEIMKSNKS